MSVLITCTSDDRPGSPSNGDLLYETDTNKLIFYYDGWITYGQSNTSTGGETPTIVFTDGESSLIQSLSSESQTGDMFLDTSPGLNELSVLTNTTSSIFQFDNLNTNRISARFLRTEKSRPTMLSIDQYITGVDQNISQMLSAGDITTTSATPDLFYVYDDDLNSNRVVVFGKLNDTQANLFQSQTDIDMKAVAQTTTQQLSTQPIDHAVTSVSSVDSNDETHGVYNPVNSGVYGFKTNKLSHNTSFNMTCSSDGVRNYSGRYIATGNGWVENSAGPYSFDMWFYLLPSIPAHTNRQLFGYSSNQLVCTIDDAGSYLSTTGSYFDTFQTAPGSVELNRWHRVTNTRDEDGNGNTYLDGQLVHTYIYTGNMYLREMAGDPAYSYNNNYMHGYVYSIGGWKRALTSDEISSMNDPTNTHKHTPYFWLFPSIEKDVASARYNKCRNVMNVYTPNTSIVQYQTDPTNRSVTVSNFDQFEQQQLYIEQSPF
jgi:hypothetical protein